MKQLVTPEELARHLDDPDWIVIDTRHELTNPETGPRVYAEGHIPGAYFMHVDYDLSGPKNGKNGRHPLPDIAEFAARLNERGVGPGKQVVIYDDLSGNYAVRLWWMLRWLGHDKAAVLDGGYPLWVKEGRPTTKEVPAPRKGAFVPRPHLGDAVDVHFVERFSESPEMKLVDARVAERFTGNQETIDPVAGHVPGAINRFWKDNLEPDGRFKAASRLREEFDRLLESAGPEQVVHMCGSGVTACHNIFAMELAGLPGSKLYPGSWSEVVRRSCAPRGHGERPMKRLAALLAGLISQLATAQLPADVVQALKPYAEFRAYALRSWHPNGTEMLVARRDGTAEIFRVDAPGAAPKAVAIEGRVLAAAFQPTDGASFVYLAEGSDGSRRLYRHDVASGASTAVSPADEQAMEFTWSTAGDRIAYATVSEDPNSATRTTLRSVDPARPPTEKLLGRLEGRWKDLRLAPNGQRVALTQEVSPTESHVWLVEVATGTRRRVTRPEGKTSGRISNPAFTKDGRALFALSDRGSEYRRLVMLPIEGGTARVLTGHVAHDVDAYSVSTDAGLLAFTSNEGGSHVMRFIDLVTLKEQPRPPLLDSVIGGLAWRPKAREIGFHVSAARTAGDVFSYEVKTNQVTRWTNGNANGVNVRDFAEPQRIKWKGHGGRDMAGLLYAPPARFEGKRPVIVDYRSGPGSQWRTGFLGSANYVVGELGVVIIRPNVRGSTGFGKSFAALPAGEDARKDITALLEWIGKQPTLDESRTLVIGAGTAGQPDDAGFLATAVDFARRPR